MRRWPAILSLAASIPALASCAGIADDEERPGVARSKDSSDWDDVTTADFNFDGMQDVLWGRAGTSEAAVWMMNGAELLAPGPVISGPSGGGWRVAYAADFDADGLSDLIWTDDSKGQMVVGLMDGSPFPALGPVVLGPSSNGWTAVTAGDFNLDGMADVLWYNASSQSMAVWLMAGTDLLQAGPVLPAPSGEGWIATSLSDFNGDGMQDVLWSNPAANLIEIWLMSGVEVLQQGAPMPGPGGDYHAVTAADFDADGMQDILWTDDSKGFMTVWLMRGTELLAPGPILAGPGPGWNTATAGDCNGDGMADAVWHDAVANEMAVWLMNGVDLLIPGPPIPGP